MTLKTIIGILIAGILLSLTEAVYSSCLRTKEEEKELYMVLVLE